MKNKVAYLRLFINGGMSKAISINVALLLVVLIAFSHLQAQSPWEALAERPSTLGIDQGCLDVKTGSFYIKLVKSSQTVAALCPRSQSNFDFTPSDKLKARSGNGLYQLGDINFRLRIPGEQEWKKFSSAARRSPVKKLNTSGSILAAADLSATFPSGMLLQVKRYWETSGDNLVLRFELKNKTTRPIEIGSLGIPMIFNNILQGHTLEQAHAHNVFYDPYIGQDAGYLQVVRLNGHGPSLVVIPYGRTPFEAYNPLLDDPTPRGIDFEGFYEWMVYSKAYANNEWKNARPWNKPTSVVLQPGEVRNYGLQFILSGTVRNVESTLVKNSRPVAVGIPGYVLPEDVTGKLFLNYNKKVTSIEVEPSNALSLTAGAVTKNRWKTYTVHGNIWGRVRLIIHYEDGLVQTIHYKVIKPESQVIADYGNFLTTKQWFEKVNDTFHRNPSVISYDYEKRQQVTQDSRVWIAGLSDEGGAGSWLGAIMKQLVMPNREELDKIQRFVDTTLWGHIQYSSGPDKYGVRKSLFYYEPDSMPVGTYSENINYKSWSAWPKKEAESIGRSYNYPHVAAAYWVMYRLSRNHTGLVTTNDWRWYLNQAYHTTLAMIALASYYAQFGQMEGTVFYFILKDLKAEGLKDMADKLEAEMKKRAVYWSSLQYPFGSEMPWDSTGQEEVYIWSYYFGYFDKTDVTINAILAYMPVIPHWAYNGNARRYWDFLYGGKLSRIERMIHHYGSALNAIPLLTEYRNKPEDFYLLRVGYGGLMGAISNITEDGFAPAAFHAFPSTLQNDGLSGDYGSGFFGYAVNTATYIVNHKEFGWLAFGGNLIRNGNWIKTQVTTSGKSSVYIAPAGLWITLAAGELRMVSYNTSSGEVRLFLNPADKYTPDALIRLEQPAHVKGVGRYQFSNCTLRHGACCFPLSDKVTEVTVKKGK
jgi:hypothetical protein